MKWRVDARVFWCKVQNWKECIADGQTTPPLIIGYTDGEFEINCNNPLYEALKSMAALNKVKVVIFY